MKHRIDELDIENFVCKYTMIEGDALGEKLESIAYEVKFEAASDGSSICKMTSKYNTIGEFEVKEEEIMAGKNSAIGIYKVVEAYLLENPNVYSWGHGVFVVDWSSYIYAINYELFNNSIYTWEQTINSIAAISLFRILVNPSTRVDIMHG